MATVFEHVAKNRCVHRHCWRPTATPGSSISIRPENDTATGSRRHTALAPSHGRYYRRDEIRRPARPFDIGPRTADLPCEQQIRINVIRLATTDTGAQARSSSRNDPAPLFL